MGQLCILDLVDMISARHLRDRAPRHPAERAQAVDGAAPVRPRRQDLQWSTATCATPRPRIAMLHHGLVTRLLAPMTERRDGAPPELAGVGRVTRSKGRYALDSMHSLSRPYAADDRTQRPVDIYAGGLVRVREM